MKHDEDILRAALAGYQAQIENISARIETIRQQLRGRTMAGVPRKRHRISAEGRKRISEAQRLRWANTKRAA